MKVLLVQPPGGSITQPYVSAPSLTAYLRKHDIETHQADPGMSILDAMLAKEPLKEMLAEIKPRFLMLDSRRELDWKEQSEYVALQRAMLTADHGIENIEASKKLMRGEEAVSAEAVSAEAVSAEAVSAEAVLAEAVLAEAVLAEAVLDYDKYFHAVKSVKAAFRIISAAHHPGKITLHGPIMPDALASTDSLMRSIKDEASNIFLEGLSNFVAESILPEAYDIVGLSISFEQQLVPALTLASIIKERSPDTCLVVGGATATKLAREKSFLKPEIFRLFDFLVAFEGETPLIQLVRAIHGEGRLDKVPNLVYLDKDTGDIVRHEVGPPEDINSLPTPTYDGLPLPLYLTPAIEVLLPVSRGCYWGRCAFCDVSAATSLKFRAREPELVVEDISKLREETGSRYFYFSVDIAAPAHLKKISKGLVEAGIDVRWASQAKFEHAFDVDTLKVMKDGGCWELIFGLESANVRILELMDKGIEPKGVKIILEACKEAGISSAVQFFVGFPTETEAEALETIRFLNENAELIDSIQFSGSFLLGSGSEVYKDQERFSLTAIGEESGRIGCEHLYTVRSGMSIMDSADMTTTILDEIRSNRGDHALYMELGAMPPLHVYFDQRSSDVFEKLAAERNQVRADVLKAISGKKKTARVMMRENIKKLTLNFDPFEAERNIARSKKEALTAKLKNIPPPGLPEPIFPNKAKFICNEITGQIYRSIEADPDVELLLELIEDSPKVQKIEERFKKDEREWAKGVMKLMELYDMGIVEIK